jgi:YfiH family protein
VELIVPDWPAPASVRAAMTTRELDVGPGRADDRRRLREALALPAEPGWLHQVHGTRVARLVSTEQDKNEVRESDASVASEAGVVCAVMAADCLPVLFCDDAGTAVGAAHAGWRGLAAGVLEATVRAMGQPGDRLMAWMGAAIGPDSFEVGAEVREAFMQVETQAHAAFRAHKPGKFMCDLYRLARMRLARAGVRHVYGGGFCTWSETGRFFSYRREQKSGRMGAFVWIMPQ